MMFTVFEPCAMESGRHLDLAVHALFAQDRDARPHALRDVRRGDVLARIVRELRGQTGIGDVAERLVFFVGA